MAEYNLMYQDLKKRILIARLLTEADCNLTDPAKSSKLSIIDALLKELDYRRQEHLYLEGVEAKVNELERK